VERVVQRDNGRRLGETVALNHQKPELSPEGFERRVQRRRAADDAPELPAEQAMGLPVTPPAPEPVPTFERIGRGRDRKDPLEVFAQHVEHLRHAHENRHASRCNLMQDLRRAVPVREDDSAAEHRGHEGGHRLAEHVAQGQQVKKPDRVKRAFVLQVLPDLTLDGHDIREHVPVGDGHALGLGGGARREDDFGQRGWRDPGRAGAPCGRFLRRFNGAARVATEDDDVRKRPDGRGQLRGRRHLQPDQKGPGRHDPADADDQIPGCPEVDRHEHDAGQQTAPQCHHPLGPVFRPDDDVVASRNAGAGQVAGECASGGGHVAVGRRSRPVAVVMNDERLVDPGEVLEEVEERVAGHVET
jgi:hypothetical protein